jgi:hypothetical protein
MFDKVYQNVLLKYFFHLKKFILKIYLLLQIKNIINHKKLHKDEKKYF